MEYIVEKTVCNKAEMAGWIVRKVKWIGRVACMDRFFLKEGRMVLIEFKKPGGHVDPDSMQDREIKRFQNAGGDVHVVNDIADGLRILGIE